MFFLIYWRLIGIIFKFKIFIFCLLIFLKYWYFLGVEFIKKRRKILCICNLVKEFYINSKNNCILIDVLIFLVVYIKIFFLMLKILIELYDYWKDVDLLLILYKF